MAGVSLANETPLQDWALILPVIAGFMGGALLLMLRSSRVYHAGIAMAVVVLIAASDFELLRRVLRDGPVSMTMGNWLPPFGISFTADVLGASCALIAAVVTLVVLAYSEMARRMPDGRDGFYALVLLLLAGVSAAFLTGDLFNLYVWFEVMLIASFGLLAIGSRPIEIDATVKYGILNFLATTLFLVGVGILYGFVGTLNMADISLKARDADAWALTSVAAILFLAFGMKAAAFPVNAWLPASYHAPSPQVSALLAGLLTKVGVYALMRTLIVLLPAGRETLAPAVAGVAVLTLVLGPLGAIAETNLRRAMGFLVIGGIGSVLAGIASADILGVAGGALYIVHAMATMTALYLLAGLIEQTTGQTDTRQMGGLYASSSPLSIGFLVLVLAAAGVPPFLGFWPKLLLLQGGFAQENWWVVGGLLANALLTLIAGTRIWSHVFWRTPVEPLQAGSASSGGLSGVRTRFGYLATGLLVAAILAAGLWPSPLLEAAHISAADLLDPTRYVQAVGLGESQ